MELFNQIFKTKLMKYKAQYIENKENLEFFIRLLINKNKRNESYYRYHDVNILINDLISLLVKSDAHSLHYAKKILRTINYLDNIKIMLVAYDNHQLDDDEDITDDNLYPDNLFIKDL